MTKYPFSTTSFLLLLIAFLLPSCKETPDNFTPDFGFDYYPLGVGMERIYRVDSFVFDEVPGDITAIDTSTTYFRDKIEEVFPGAVGDSSYRIERSFRKDTNEVWQFLTNYTVNKSVQNVQTNINNVRLIPLAFPVERGQLWNPTVFIADGFTAPIAGEEIEIFKNWSARIRETGFSDTIGGKIYTDLAKVELADEENAIELRRVTDIYARGIGLVQREMWILNTQKAGADTLSWEQKAEEGFILQQTLLDYK